MPEQIENPFILPSCTLSFHKQYLPPFIMMLSNETIVAIIALLIMCLPGLRFFMRIIRRGDAQPTQVNTIVPLELISMPDDPVSLEGGILYARRTVTIDTFMIRSTAVPSFRWAFQRHGSELDNPHT
ncbi:hypothetical protein F4820DRAFT_415764 [Hypoxylon rubiginosum]|uniref:Uncharacterized protein n=1 Tax=Hypoxylon rubiginosum TaxID=110542 RepID=A0ACB9Z6H6_9PEZI|nr:hypothetical protein F4820DRAFT_415764 [Hypoxylon rubiginosum]